jgi:hypothetical protein
MTDFSVYLTSIGIDNYQMFVKNNASKADFIRIIVGYTEMAGGERVGRVVDSWIISSLKSSDEHVFIRQLNKQTMLGRRPWVAFEAVQRHNPKNTTIGCFIALSPAPSRWHKTVGSTTYFDIKAIDSLGSLEKQNSPSLARMSQAIPEVIIP